MTSPNRQRLRSRQACLNCRRKKVRCPAERPACSTCMRLKQSCNYTAGDPRQSDRLAYLERQVNLLLNGNERQPSYAQFEPDTPPRDLSRPLAASSLEAQLNCETYEIPGQSKKLRAQHPSNDLENREPSVEFRVSTCAVSQATITQGIDIYFKLFHRQLIWCFDREDLEHTTEISSDIVYSILELTSRFTQKQSSPHYGEMAKSSIMLRAANGTVALETIEGLCLLSYSAFIDGDRRLGQFYLGLGFQLCRYAGIDRDLTSSAEDSAIAKCNRKLLWSLQALEQFYSDQDGVLSTAPEAWRQYYVSRSWDLAFPRDSNEPSASPDLGIWSFAMHFGWVWSRAREYVSACFRNELTEPWRLDSMYAKVLADMTDIENKVPLCHRYENVQFYKHRADEINFNRDYWVPWIKLQFTWHSIHTVLNHPFLYIVASKRHSSLAIPNTFWRKSSELVLLHATWIVRTIDMVSEKKLRLVDPFFAHAAAIAATVHLYFCCAADPRLKQKSKADFVKCKEFLRSFVPFSALCESLLQSLDKITQIATGSPDMNAHWSPWKIRLSIPLMWSVLLFNVSSSQGTSSGSSTLLGASPIQGDSGETEKESTLEISVATSPPEVTVDPVLGHNSCLPPYMTAASSTDPSDSTVGRDIVVPPADSLMFNTPWLWDMNIGIGLEPDLTTGEGFSSWWDFGNL